MARSHRPYRTGGTIQRILARFPKCIGTYRSLIPIKHAAGMAAGVVLPAANIYTETTTAAVSLAVYRGGIAAELIRRLSRRCALSKPPPPPLPRPLFPRAPRLANSPDRRAFIAESDACTSGGRHSRSPRCAECACGHRCGYRRRRRWRGCWRLTDAVIDNVIDHCVPKLRRVDGIPPA